MLLVAHRTPRSRAGCERLAAAGARVFEADVQLDDRERVVVSHYLPFGRAGLLQRDNWRLRWGRAAGGDPQLVDVAALVPDCCTVLLDVKERAADRRTRLCAALAAGLPERERFRVSAPDAADLARLRAAGFRTWHSVDDGRRLRAVLAGDPVPDEAVTVRHTLLTGPAVERLHRLGALVIAWTVNDRRRAQQLAALGVDGITTDSAAVLRAMQQLAN